MDYFEKDVIKDLIKSKIEQARVKFGKDFAFCLIEILSLENMLTENNNKTGNTKCRDKIQTTQKATFNISEEIPPEPKFQRQIPLSQWNNYYPDPSVPAMRALDFNRAENGFDEFKVTERRGKRVLVNEDNYFAWKEAYKQ